MVDERTNIQTLYFSASNMEVLELVFPIQSGTHSSPTTAVQEKTVLKSKGENGMISRVIINFSLCVKKVQTVFS